MAIITLSISGPDFGKHLAGLGTDDKPTSDLGDLATFWETDTGLKYTWTRSAWILTPSIAILADPSDRSRQAEFDALFTIPVVIDAEHHEIHEGDSFECSAVDITVANEATMALAFKTPAAPKHIHLTIDFITLTGGHMELISAPTWTNQSGDLQAIKNAYDGAGSSAILEDQAQASFVASDNMILDPGSLAGGTVIHTVYAFGQRSQFTGESRGRAEKILAAATQYAVRFTSDAPNNKVFMTLRWYEHTDE